MDDENRVRAIYDMGSNEVCCVCVCVRTCVWHNLHHTTTATTRV